MSTSIDQSFIRDYTADVHEAFQRRGSFLRNAVRQKNSIIGESTTFQKVGKGTATTKARHGAIPPMNQDHTPITCTLSDRYAGDWVDKLDEARTNIDERMVIANGGAFAIGRAIDNDILTVADGTTQSVVTITLTSKATVRDSLLTWVQALNDNDVPDDGQRYAVVSPFVWSLALLLEEFSSADYVGPDGLPYTQAAPREQMWKDWMGIKWKSHTGVPGHNTATEKNFLWHKTAIGYAMGADITPDITWHGDHAAHFVNHWFSGGACLIDDNGVIEANVDATASRPTT